MKGPVAFVVPRFGPGVVGGAEAVCREVALGLTGRGWEVEMLTTCAIDHYTWANDLDPGTRTEEGLTVRRWEMIYDATVAGLRAQGQIQDGIVPSFDEQISWISLRFQVPGLFHHLVRRGACYRAIVFAPYLFWTSTVCLPVVADRAISLPCLHDETYARLDAVRPVLADPAQVWFLSEPEHLLAHRLGAVAPRHQVVGAGVEVPACYDPDGFRRRHRLSRPFVLYAGRRERDKGWPWLLDSFARAVALGGVEVDLVTAGVGDVEAPADIADRVVDLGFLPAGELNDAFAAAAAYIQPSGMESFSRTVMESWLAGTPVLAWDRSEVVVWHCQRSGGGRTFADHVELAECLRWLVASPAEAAEMAERGRRYVLSEYSWPVVLDRMEADLDSFPPAGAVPPPPAGEECPPPGGARGGQPPGPVMVVGSYPPAPVPTARTTLDQVRQAYAGGDDVVVVAPRHGAAHRTCRVAGPRAGARLALLRHQTGARRLVFCAERGMPLPPAPATRAGRWAVAHVQGAIARRLVAAFAGFDRVTLVLVGDLGVSPAALGVLRGAATEVVEVAAPPGPPPPGTVTVFGPPEVLARQRPRQLISIAARAVLGPLAPTVRRWLVAAWHVVRPASRTGR